MRVPNANDLDAAWDGLSPAQQREIGRMALDMVFYAFLGGGSHSEEDKVLKDADARGAADDVSNRALTNLHTVIEDTLPDLFGPAGGDPAWATASEGTSTNG